MLLDIYCVDMAADGCRLVEITGCRSVLVMTIASSTSSTGCCIAAGVAVYNWLALLSGLEEAAPLAKLENRLSRSSEKP